MKNLSLRRLAADAMLAIAILAVIAASADADSPVSDTHFFTHIVACAAIAAASLYCRHRLTKALNTQKSSLTNK